jgi:hypothetical protein
LSKPTNEIEVYLEIGKKRAFAGAVDWPGWCRSGRDEPTALKVLDDYGPRYNLVLQESDLGVQLPVDAFAFSVIERLEGTATTDFGAPDIALPGDVSPINKTDLRRFQSILKACWKIFDKFILNASEKELRKGPRGGGRDLHTIFWHVIEADIAYLSRIGWKVNRNQNDRPDQVLDQTRQAILNALETTAPVGVPEPGPRGGQRWPARYFMRRVAWHALDHAWEIEDRITVKV